MLIRFPDKTGYPWLFVTMLIEKKSHIPYQVENIISRSENRGITSWDLASFLIRLSTMYRLPCYHMHNIILGHLYSFKLSDHLPVTHDNKPGTGTQHLLDF